MVQYGRKWKKKTPKIPDPVRAANQIAKILIPFTESGCERILGSVCALLGIQVRAGEEIRLEEIKTEKLPETDSSDTGGK